MATRKPKPKPVSTSTVPLAVIKKGAKPSKAASTDQTRPTLCQGFLRKNGKGWELLTTNAYIMARVPVSVDGNKQPKGGPIPVAALKHAEGSRAGALLLTDEHVEPATREGFGSDILYLRRDLGNGPDFDKILNGQERKRPFTVGLDAKLLHDLAQALGTEQVGLTFDAENNRLPIKVDTPTGEGDGVLMPVRIVR